MSLLQNLNFYLLIWNLIVFIFFGVDKFLSRHRKRRVRERTLILLSFLMGSFGAMMGMVVFNHKTSKTKFRALVPISVFVNMIILYILKKWML